jgi:putative DNA primase/helicase
MSGGGKPVTIATVIYEAKQGGWKPARSEPPPPEVLERHKKEREQRQAEAKRLEAERAEEAAAIAADIWANSEPARDDHPYLQKKQVPAYGLRQSEIVWLKFIDDDTGEIKGYEVKNALIIPAYTSAKKLSSVQIITGDGKKRFLLDGKMAGAYAKIGEINKTTEKIVICEGWATGASIHLATGLPVVVAFNAGNLKPVSEKMQAALPSSKFLIAADDDAFTKRRDGTPYNPGIEAAQATGLPYVTPLFRSLEGEPTDMNDLHTRQGIDAVLAMFEARIPESAVEPTVSLSPAQVPAIMPRAVDIFSPLPDTNDRMKPLSTIDNVLEICSRLGITVRYNVIAKEEEILIPDESFSIDNQANASFAWLTSWCAKFRMPTANLGDYVTYLSDKNLFNPVAQWIESKPWDGISRLPELYATIKAKDDGDELKEILIKRWMISAVAAAFSPDGVSAAGVLVLQGDQYLGKTKWFKSLVPESLGVVKDGMLLRPDDKDSVKQVCSFWLVELGELDATFRRSDIAALKSFITAKSDVLRRAYARKESHFARRTVFFGSVNPREFLHDATGNRRYWTIECASIDHSHSVDMQQAWAEVYALWRGGEGFYLSPTEMAALNHHNENFTVADPINERIQTSINWEADLNYWDWKTATDVLISIGIDRPTNGDATKAAQCIRALNGNKGKRSNGKSLLFVPPKRDRF